VFLRLATFEDFGDGLSGSCGTLPLRVTGDLHSTGSYSYPRMPRLGGSAS
jgi:hypothetical protein